MKPKIAPHQIAVGVVLVGLGWLLNSASQPFKRNARTSMCQSNLKQIGLAILQYERDYDESFPLAPNWADSLKPYSSGIRNSSDKADFEKRFRCPTSESYYAFNEFCAGQSAQNIGNWQEVPMVFDVAWGQRNFVDDGNLWPTDPPIHGRGKYGGNNVLFADAHVKLMTIKPNFRLFVARAPKPIRTEPTRTAKP